MKKIIFSVIGLSIVIMLFGCAEKGEYIPLKPKEVRELLLNKGTGFMYVESFLNTDDELDTYLEEEIQKVAKKEGQNIYLFDPSTIPSDDPDLDDYGVKTRTQTLAYYKNGELIGKLDFRNIKNDSPQEVRSNIKFFIQDMK